MASVALAVIPAAKAALRAQVSQRLATAAAAAAAAAPHGSATAYEWQPRVWLITPPTTAHKLTTTVEEDAVTKAESAGKDDDMRRLCSAAGAALEQIDAAELWHGARHVGVFIGVPSLYEVDTAPVIAALLAAGKRVSVPRFQPRSRHMDLLAVVSPEDVAALPRNRWGIPEPALDDATRQDAIAAAEPIDLLLCPGAAFDARGRRLGRGKGYYDAFIARLQQRRLSLGLPRARLVAITTALQLVDDVPVESHDAAMDAIAVPLVVSAELPGGA